MMDGRQIAVERFCAKVGFALRMARLHRGLTIAELAKNTGIGRRAIVNLERGEKYDATLSRIAELFWELGFEPEFSAIAIETEGQDRGAGLGAEHESAAIAQKGSQ